MAAAVPTMALLPRAAAAVTICVGRATWVWYPVTLNCSPVLGSGGASVPEVVTLLSTMFPTGVPGQYSS